MWAERFCLPLLLAFCSLIGAVIKPPVAKKLPTVLSFHNDTLVDNYGWLRNIDIDDDVWDYIRQEQNYTLAVSESWHSIRESLEKEMSSLYYSFKYEGNLEYVGGWESGLYRYYKRYEKGKDHPDYYRKSIYNSSSEELIFSVSELAANSSYFALCSFDVSPSQSFIAFAYDKVGNERCVLQFKDLVDDKVIDYVSILNASENLEWSSDSSEVLYTVQDDLSTHRYVYRYHIFQLIGPDNPTLLFEELDVSLTVSLERTSDRKFIIINSLGFDTNECRLLSADHPQPFVFAKRARGVQYQVEHNNETFYIRTNADGAFNFKIMSVSAQNISKANWVEVIPHNPKRYLISVVCYSKFLVVWFLENANKKFLLYTIGGSQPPTVYENQWKNGAFWPGPLGLSKSLTNFNSSQIIFTNHSYTQPAASFVLDVNTLKAERLVTTTYPTYKSEKYCERRIWALSEQNGLIKIPIDMVYAKDTKGSCSDKPYQRPMLLRGYGAYGAVSEPYFDILRTILLDRGFIVADAHIRGGADMGYQWYTDAKYERKNNTILDFISCIKYVTDNDYTKANRLAIWGASAGGLPVGGAANIVPHLIRTVVGQVPFMDPIGDMIDPSVPLTTIEWFEWGDPVNNESIYYAMKGYSPYENLRSHHYPHILVTAGVNDKRVPFYEPLKYVAKLRELKTDKNLLLALVYDRGHFASVGMDYVKENAFVTAFLLRTICGPNGNCTDPQVDEIINVGPRSPDSHEIHHSSNSEVIQILWPLQVALLLLYLWLKPLVAN